MSSCLFVPCASRNVAESSSSLDHPVSTCLCLVHPEKRKLHPCMHVSFKASFKLIYNIDLSTCVCLPQNTCVIIFKYEQLVLVWVALCLFALFWMWLWFAVICTTHQNYNWYTSDMVLKHEQCVDDTGVTCITCASI